MTDRELMQMALDTLEKIIEGCGSVKEENEIHADAKSLATEVRKDCFKIAKTLRARLAQAPQVRITTPEHIEKIKSKWVGFTHEELAWLDEALNLNRRFAVIEAIEAKLKQKNTRPLSIKEVFKKEKST